VDAVWAPVAVISGVLVAAGMGRFLWSLRPQADMSGLPPTPLEKLGWVGLGVTIVVGLGLGLLVGLAGADFIDENTTARGIFWLLMLGGTGFWVASWRYLKRRSGATVIDERDRAILARSLSVESIIVLLSLVGWTIVLTEVYSDEGVMPIGFLQLIFWSTFISGAFGRSLGIVMGYRREIPANA